MKKCQFILNDESFLFKCKSIIISKGYKINLHSKKEILFYSNFYKPETGAAAIRADYFVEALKNVGYNVLVIAPKPNYPMRKIFNGYKKKILVKDKIENIIYIPILFVGFHSQVGRLFSRISYCLFSFFYLLFKKYKPDVVISSSPPIFTSLAALIYSKLKSSKFIFDIRDIWPDALIELGLLKNRFSKTIITRIERYILENSDQIIVTAEGDKRNIENKIGNSVKCEVIYNGADTSIFKPIDENERVKIRNMYSIPINKKVVVYFGTFNNAMNDIKTLEDFLIHKDFNSEVVHFLSIGSGYHYNDFIKKINNRISYTAINPLPMNEVAKLVAASDISIIPRKKIKKDTGGNIPVKCFESWAAGIPVLLANIKFDEISEIFRKCEFGVHVESNRVEALIEGLIVLLKDNLDELGNKGRDFVVDNFDRKKQSQKLLNII